MEKAVIKQANAEMKSCTKLVNKKKIHFMGIGGSGISAVAALAKKHGFIVSGCDEQQSTPYLDKLKKLGIKVFRGHDAEHLDDCDQLVISPAIIYQNANNAEYKKAVLSKKVIVWNKFVGEHLLENKNVIAVSGTHGKGTTTAMLSIVLESASFDPNVIIGATVPAWNSNYRLGESGIFVIEADEFYEKFLDYRPSTIIINNIEFDHPDYFKSENALIKTFSKFVKLLQGDKNLIINLDSEGVQQLLKSTAKLRGINIFGYSLKPNHNVKGVSLTTGSIISKTPEGTSFSVYSDSPSIDGIYKLSIPGEYNVSNALGIIIAAKLANVEDNFIHDSLLKFDGLARRFEKVYDRHNITVYDDYAHHPTAILRTLEALRQRYPARRIICIDEPHSYSRTKALLPFYKGAFNYADKVIIGPIFKARDIKTFNVKGEDIVKNSLHKDIIYIGSQNKIVQHLKKEIKSGDVIIVMGAGESYIWTQQILKAMK